MGTIIYQIALPEKRAKEIEKELKNEFERDSEVKIRVFLLKEITPQGIKKIAVKITAKNLLKAQKAAAPIFQYLSLLELAVESFPEEEMFIDTGNKDNLSLQIKGEKVTFFEILKV